MGANEPPLFLQVMSQTRNEKALTAVYAGFTVRVHQEYPYKGRPTRLAIAHLAQDSANAPLG
jgi:hypothetical protein